jgi:hypothetical protein
MYSLLAEAFDQLKKMGILDSTMEWTQTLAGIKDHSNTTAEMMNAYFGEQTSIVQNG